VSITGKAALGLAVLALAGGAGLAAASPAGATTTACGNPCMTLSNLDFGSGYVTAVAGGVPVIGAAVRLLATADSPAEDWLETDAGPVADLAAQGRVSPEIEAQYDGLDGFEFQFAPGGVASGLCLGLATAAHEGGRVTLRRCGVSSRTIWLADPAAQRGRFAPIVSGSDTSSTFDQSLVLTSRANGRTLTMNRVSIADDGVASDQMWQTLWGALS
jgi:hypothetical protein